MKKLFSLLALVAAMMFTACGSDGGSNRAQSVDALPNDLQEFVYDLRTMIIHKWDSRETRFNDIVVEGNDLVCRFTYDEDEVGMSLRRGFYRDLDEDDLHRECVRRVRDKCENSLDALQKHKFNIVLRFTGSDSRYVRTVRVSYRDF